MAYSTEDLPAGAAFDVNSKTFLNICSVIKMDAQGKDSKSTDKRVEQILDVLQNFRTGKITDTVYDDIMNRIDELIEGMKE